MPKSLFFVLILATSSLWISAQQPKVVHTQLHTEPLSTGLSATVTRFQRSPGPLWVGYRVQALPQTHLSACSSWTGSPSVEAECCDEYRLEDTANHLNNSDRPETTNQDIDVLLRIDKGVIDRVRLAPASCTLNAGELPLNWLTEVPAEESVALLSHLAEESSAFQREKTIDESLVALSMHATPKATESLAGLAAAPHTDHLREKAAFWLGAQRGHDGFLALQRLVKQETDPALRQKLAFDLSINSDPASIDELIHMAKSDADSAVRGQALFWLAQKAGKKATGALQDSMENDPDLQVKKKAVFALSQLPKDESLPQLQHVAETNQNLAIRKEAIFWLGQTNDPRALAYLEQVLKR